LSSFSLKSALGSASQVKCPFPHKQVSQHLNNADGYLPAFLLFLSLSFSPFSHLRPDGLLTEMESQAQLSPCKNLAPRLPKRRDSGHQSKCLQAAFGVNHNRGAPVADGLLEEEVNGIGDQQKRQRQRHAHYRQPFTRVQFPGSRFPANLDANQ